jgi:hypothetical protein
MRILARPWLMLSILVSLALLIQGLIILIAAAPVTIGGYGTISTSDVLIFGLLLLAVGLASLIFGAVTYTNPILFEEGSRLSITSKLIKIIGGLAVAIEGLALALIAGKMVVEGGGTYETYVVAAFSAQLFMLGTGLMMLELLAEVQFKLSRFLVYFGGLIVASEAVSIIGIAQVTYIEGLGYIMESTVLLAGAQLMVIGLLFMISQLMLDRLKKWNGLFSVLRLTTGALIVIEGLAITVMATNVTPADIGTITTRTLVIAGVQLAIFGGIALLMVGGKNTSYSFRLARLSSAAALILMLLIPAAYLTVGSFW